MAAILVAAQSFSCEIDGEHYSVQGGVTRVREGHPLALANPAAFKALSVHYDVEDASATPGRGRESSVSTEPAPKVDGRRRVKIDQ